MTRYSRSGTDGPAGESDGTDPALEDALGALADERRRDLLRSLLERDGEGPVGVGELAEEIADESDAEDVRRSLRHAHLPRLDGAGIVAYDAREGEVRLAGDQPAVEDFLEAAEGSRN
ncbi:DUF7344 domain-containing protein [Halorussus sp. AFM4]|uniref:DUF7344 domain-containing protein n=1 Tax=Halorussus sp. AFM4 TaxID=3421651 RepID=UPI003EBC8366